VPVVLGPAALLAVGVGAAPTALVPDETGGANALQREAVQTRQGLSPILDCSAEGLAHLGS
jgi:DUF917 family protein